MTEDVHAPLCQVILAKAMELFVSHLSREALAASLTRYVLLFCGKNTTCTTKRMLNNLEDDQNSLLLFCYIHRKTPTVYLTLAQSSKSVMQTEIFGINLLIVANFQLSCFETLAKCRNHFYQLMIELTKHLPLVR